MKKTLITLLALAGVAMASTNTITLTLPDALLGTTDNGNQALTWDTTAAGISTLESWSLQFDVTDKTLENNTYLFGTDKGDNGAAGYYVASHTNGSITFGYRVNDTATAHITTDAGVLTANTATTITLQFIADVNIETKEVVGGIFTLTCGNEEYSYTLGDNDDLDDTAITSGANCRFWTNMQNGAPRETFSNISLTRLDSKLVPEPTTATLSLLALAGLAARRRRK